MRYISIAKKKFYVDCVCKEKSCLLSRFVWGTCIHIYLYIYIYILYAMLVVDLQARECDVCTSDTTCTSSMLNRKFEFVCLSLSSGREKKKISAR